MSCENAELLVSKTARLSRRRLVVAGVVGLVFLIPFARFIWTTSRTETGRETISWQWRDATVGLVAGEHQYLTYREPVEQAAFWLAETDRIVAKDPKNPEVLMGAAVLLAQPGIGFELRHMRFTGSFPDPDRDAIDRAIGNFENWCHPKCLALAKRATELQPDEPRWWRLRATLLFAGQWNKEGRWADRVPNWLAVLQECQRHDPDNALYDYLAAQHYWKDAVSYGVPIANPRVPIQSPPVAKGTAASVAPLTPTIDQAKYKRGMKHFLNGQKKRFCADAGACQPGMLVLNALRRSTVPRVEHFYIVSSSHPASAFDTIRGLWRVQQVRAEQLDNSGDAAGALVVYRQYRRMFDQVTVPDKQDVTCQEGVFLRLSLFSPVKTLVEKHPNLVSAEEAARIKRNAEKAQNDQKIWWDASKRLMKQRDLPTSPSLVTVNELTTAAVSALPLLLLAGVIASAAATWSRRNSERDAARLGVVRHTIAWLVGYVVTFVTFGMAPAKIIPPAAQNWLFSGSIALLFAVAACWVCWKVAVRRKLQFSIRFLLIVTAVWALLLGFLKTCDVLPCNFSDLHVPAISVPAHRVNGIDPGLFEQQWTSLHGRWNWALDQWLAYRGPIIGIGAALMILAVWHQFRLCRIHSKTPIPSRDRWARRFACLGRSMLTVAALWMLVYLWLAPTVIRGVERENQTNMAYIEKPQEYLTALKKAIAEIHEEQSWRKGMNPNKANGIARGPRDSATPQP